jgi:hypothetical protein
MFVYYYCDKSTVWFEHKKKKMLISKITNAQDRNMLKIDNQFAYTRVYLCNVDKKVSEYRICGWNSK